MVGVCSFYFSTLNHFHYQRFYYTCPFFYIIEPDIMQLNYFSHIIISISKCLTHVLKNNNELEFVFQVCCGKVAEPLVGKPLVGHSLGQNCGTLTPSFLSTLAAL